MAYPLITSDFTSQRTYKVSSRTGNWKLRNSHSPRSEGTFHVDTPENTLIDRWIEDKGLMGDRPYKG